MHPEHPLGADRHGISCSCHCSCWDFDQQLCFGGRNPEAKSCPCAASSHLPGCRTGLSLTEGLGMGEIHPVAESVIPQDKGWWDQLRCITRGREVAEGQVPCRPCPGGLRVPHRGTMWGWCSWRCTWPASSDGFRARLMSGPSRRAG